MHSKRFFFSLLVLALIIMLCSIFGLPWFVAATVMSINHIQAFQICLFLNRNYSAICFSKILNTFCIPLFGGKQTSDQMLAHDTFEKSNSAHPTINFQKRFQESYSKNME